LACRRGIVTALSREGWLAAVALSRRSPEKVDMALVFDPSGLPRTKQQLV